jgi:hypothetical protein
MDSTGKLLDEPRPGAERRVSIRTIASGTRRAAYAAIILAIILALVLMIWTADTEIDEAVAGVCAAFIGVAGTSLGHAVGLDRERRRRRTPARAVPGNRFPRWQAVVATAVMVAIPFLPGVVLLAGDLPRVSIDAAAALLAALVGIAATDLAHKWFLSRVELRWLGYLLLGGGLLSVLVLVPFPDHADVIAAIATTVIPIGGTVVGFAHGRRTAKALSGEPA